MHNYWLSDLLPRRKKKCFYSRACAYTPSAPKLYATLRKRHSFDFLRNSWNSESLLFCAPHLSFFNLFLFFSLQPTSPSSHSLSLLNVTKDPRYSRHTNGHDFVYCTLFVILFPSWLLAEYKYKKKKTRGLHKDFRIVGKETLSKRETENRQITRYH